MSSSEAGSSSEEGEEEEEDPSFIFEGNYAELLEEEDVYRFYYLVTHGTMPTEEEVEEQKDGPPESFSGVPKISLADNILVDEVIEAFSINRARI